MGFRKLERKKEEWMYECPYCGEIWSVIRNIDEHEQEDDCPECGEEAIWPHDSVPYTKESIKSKNKFKMKEVNVTLAEGQQVLEIRQGEAAEIRELINLDIRGTINSPAKFLMTRREQIEISKTHIYINEDAGTIKLIANDREEVGRIEVLGELKLHPDFVRTGVNTDKARTTFQLAKWIRMNRPMFESNAEAARLVKDLREFKAKVEKTVEDNEDDRANVSMKRSQAVETSIPKGFKLSVPLFVGAKRSNIDVEIVIDPDDLSCSLLSPDAADLIKKEKESTLASQVKNFNDYVVIYV